jgi:D-arabinose 1-dehydrogenase-like Zn-dependent alcohol dehydrogenase
MQNPSIVLYGPKSAKLEDTAIPELVDPHDVLVRINYVGVCGSDVSPFASRPRLLIWNIILYQTNTNDPRSTFGTTAA